MPSHVKVGGTWRTITEVHVKVAGTWRKLTAAAVRVAGTWRDVLDVPLNGSVSPAGWADIYNEGTAPHSRVFTANPSGGSGAYTYSWSHDVGGASLANATSQSCTLTVNSDGVFQGTLTCQISDGVNTPINRSASIDVIVGIPP